MKQLQFSAPALPFVFASLSDETVQPLQIKAPGRERPKVMDLDDEGIKFCRPATAAEMEACPKEHRSFLYRAETPRRSSLNSSLERVRKPSPSMMTIGRHSRKMMRSAANEADVSTELGPSGNAEDVIDAPPADSAAPRLEAGSTHQVLELAMKGYCFV